jgi:hypothetical protein
VDEFPARIAYFHVELDRHTVLLVEGLAVESYLDTGNRALFRAEAEARARHPELAAAAWDERAADASSGWQRLAARGQA